MRHLVKTRQDVNTEDTDILCIHSNHICSVKLVVLSCIVGAVNTEYVNVLACRMIVSGVVDYLQSCDC